MLLKRGETTKPDASKALALLVRERLGLSDEATVSIAEIACGEPACGGAETIILVMRSGFATESITLKMPVASVGEDDLGLALAAYKSSQ